MERKIIYWFKSGDPTMSFYEDIEDNEYWKIIEDLELMEVDC